MIRLKVIWYVLLGRGVMYRMHVQVPRITFMQTKHQALVVKNRIEVIGTGGEGMRVNVLNVKPKQGNGDSYGESAALLLRERGNWDARCHFCAGPSYPWLTDDETWAQVEPILGQQQACFECFGAAWFLLGLNDGEPFCVRPSERWLLEHGSAAPPARSDTKRTLP